MRTETEIKQMIEIFKNSIKHIENIRDNQGKKRLLSKKEIEYSLRENQANIEILEWVLE